MGEFSTIFERVADNMNARKNLDVNSFMQNVMRDESDNPIELAEIHEAWHEHVNWCFENKMFCGILAPWGHGKSVQMAIGRSLWEIGQNHNIRMKIISAADEIATSRIAVIKSCIEDEQSEFRKLFSDVEADSGKPWTGSKIFIKRDGMSSDPTIQACSILSNQMGARADIIMFDDVVDLRNAILNPGLREKVKEAFRSAWLSRLEPTGRVIYIATVWHEDDLSMELLSNEKFSFLIQSVNDAMDGIECRYTNRKVGGGDG